MLDSGEQYVPGESSQRLREEHVNRYDYAKSFCVNKDVLDIACGTGYGSYEISKIAKSVIGVDISEEAVSYAKSSFVKDNLSYEKNDCKEIKFENKFDVVLSFETIEHLEQNERYVFLSLIHKSLKKDGIFIISTPNKKVTSPYTVKPLNKFHVIEFTKERLEEELKNFFEIEGWFGQRFLYKFFLIKAVRKCIRLIEKIFNYDFGLYSTRYSPKVTAWENNLKEPRILIALCKKKK